MNNHNRLKQCSKCKQVKLLNDFHANQKSSDRKASQCKKCTKETALKWYNEDKERTHILGRKWYLANKDKFLKQNKSWRSSHPENVRLIKRKYASKLRSIPNRKLNLNLSCAISRSLTRNKCGNHWEYLVGYTVEKLKKHLEKQFNEKMSWDNYGSYWEVDHIVPINVFNFGSSEDIDFKRCWNLENLQPLECKKNRSKGARISKPFQPSLRLSINPTGRAQGQPPD
jgi:5-methylcytosine-specific restriction endonuclease McrA